MKNMLQDLSDIRTMMEEATKFPSLSGLSGVMVGLLAIGGTIAAFVREPTILFDLENAVRAGKTDVTLFLALDAAAVLVLALSVAVLLSLRMARRKKLPVWNRTARLLVTHLCLPLIAGALFCTALAVQNLAYLLPAVMLIFYGLALLNASKYTLAEIRYLGITQVLLGVVASFWISFSVWFWMLGFGFLHIIYGAYLYWRYER